MHRIICIEIDDDAIACNWVNNIYIYVNLCTVQHKAYIYICYTFTRMVRESCGRLENYNIAAFIKSLHILTHTHTREWWSLGRQFCIHQYIVYLTGG